MRFTIPSRWLARLGIGLTGAGLMVLALAACNTPFIPIPPPGNPTFTPIITMDGMGTRTVWETRGAPSARIANALVFVYNRDAERGVIAKASADGSYVADPIAGNVGDRIQIFYEQSTGEDSPGICRLLQQGVAQTECPR
jgi:hypothetical protein